MVDIKSALLKRIEKTSTCWLWCGFTKKKRGGEYGLFTVRFADGSRKTMAAHRWMFQEFKGELKPGLVVCHRCDNPRCVRPSHLVQRTVKWNNKDRQRKGRGVQLRGERHARSVVSEKDVLAIFKSDEPQRRLAERYGVSQSAIMSIKTGRTWSWLTQEKAS